MTRVAAMCALVLVGCGRTLVVPPVDDTATSFETRVLEAQRAATRLREARFDEALEPGITTARRRTRLENPTLDTLRDEGWMLFHLDAPFDVGPFPVVKPVGGAADATRCVGCHHVGGAGGSGSAGDVVFENAQGDDVMTARRRLPRMLAGAALLELAGNASSSRTPFGWVVGERPRTLRGMVEHCMRTHLGESPERAEVDALTTFIALLPAPIEALPTQGSLTMHAVAGQAPFTSLGCASCHVPEVALSGARIGLGRGRSLDVTARIPQSGTARMYSDLLPHRMGEARADADGNDRFVTPPLWGLASRGPYLHDGAAASIQEAILMHAGEAQAARDAYLAHPEAQPSLRMFLTALTRPPHAEAIP